MGCASSCHPLCLERLGALEVPGGLASSKLQAGKPGGGDQHAVECNRARLGCRVLEVLLDQPWEHTFTRAMAVHARAFPARGNTRTSPSEHGFAAKNQATWKM